MTAAIASLPAADGHRRFASQRLATTLARRAACALLLALTPGLTIAAPATAASTASTSTTPSAAPGAIDVDLLSGLAARSIGPAGMSGRVAAIAAVDSHPATIYVGAATGGVWKSLDAGITWDPIFDDQPVAAIGAIAIYQPVPDIVWIGTGEGNPRNSASVGNGVYRSLDGGRTWRHLGLAKSERIHRIILHPSDPDVAWVAAMGPAWGEGGERGVYKTSDGGRSWRRVLAVDERTGAAELVIDPSNPLKLFAAMWDYRRWPWSFRSGGPGSGLFVSHDGGEAWKRLAPEDGLPEGDLGRIGLAIAPSQPNVVYALVEAEKNVLLRSDDGGKSFRTVNEERNVASRPFYYADIRVDPSDANRLYNLASTVKVSTDGGKSFATLIGWDDAHPDHHALWIHPRDPELLIDGNDGGVSISHDRGRSWRFVENLPIAQYYHVRYDLEQPYNLYGGMQDNGSWRGPAEVWENGGIRNHHWQEVGFGDGFDTVPDPTDARRGYAMSQGGQLHRYDLVTGERRSIRPPAPLGADGKPVRLRFNWNAGIAIDPFAPQTLYYGSQFVHRSTDRGETWTIVSGDLTTNNPAWQRQAESGGLTPDVTAAENYTTIIAIAPSPRERGVLWVGTDDGRLHVSRDGGASWTSVEGNLRGVPKNTWIPHIEPSPHDGATAFVVLDDHRRSNWAPYVYRTRDYGKTWQSLATKDLDGYALAIAQDPVDPELLFLGTEFGLWVSIDGGGRWLRWRHGFPTVSTMDLAIHPREHDLLIATHGRSAYVIDDIRPLRELSSAIVAKPLHLFAIAPTQQHYVRQVAGARFPGDSAFIGKNRAYGALVSFWLDVPGLPHPIDEKERARKAAERRVASQRERELHDEPGGGGVPPRVAPEPATAGVTEPASAAAPGAPPTPGMAAAPAAGEAPEKGGKKKDAKPKAKLTVRDAAGRLVRSFEAPVVRGLNRVAWGLTRDAWAAPPEEDERGDDEPGEGPEVPPGTYTVTVEYGEQRATGTVEVLPDPRYAGAAGWAAHWQAVERAGALQELVAKGVERIVASRRDLDAVERTLAARDKDEERARNAVPVAAGSAAGAAPVEPDPATPAGRRKALRATIERFRDRLKEAERLLWKPPDVKGIVDDTDALSRIEEAQWFLDSWEAPSPSQLTYLEQAGALTQTAVAALDAIYAESLPALRAALRDSGIELLPELPPLLPTAGGSIEAAELARPAAPKARP